MSLKELWRATSFMFWEHPILWLPVLFADFLNFFLRMLQRSVGHQIVLWLWSRHQSVLGGMPDPAPFGSMERAVAVLVGPINLIFSFAETYLYAAALIIITALVGQFQLGASPRLLVVAHMLREKVGRIALLSLKVMIGFALFMFVDVWFFARLYTRPASATVVTGFSLVLLACVIAPSALRVLQTNHNRENNAVARAFASGSVIAYVALGYFCGIAIGSIQGLGSPTHTFARVVTQIATSWIGAFPHIVLFIGLALLATAQTSTQALEEVPAE